MTDERLTSTTVDRWGDEQFLRKTCSLPYFLRECILTIVKWYVYLRINFFLKEIRTHSSFIHLPRPRCLLLPSIFSSSKLANGKNWAASSSETRRLTGLTAAWTSAAPPRAIFPRCGTSLALSVDIHAQCPGFFVFRQQWLATVTSCVAIAQSARLHRDKGVEASHDIGSSTRGSLQCSCIGMRRQFRSTCVTAYDWSVISFSRGDHFWFRVCDALSLDD